MPGGAALGIGVTVSMLRSWGIPVPDIVLASVVSGVWNNFVKLGLPILALALLALTGSPGAGLVTAARHRPGRPGRRHRHLRPAAAQRGAGPAASARSHRPWPASRCDWCGASPPADWDERAVAFRQQIIGLLAGRWLWITLATVLSHLSLFLVLLVALRNVGVSEQEVSTAKALAGFAFVRLLSAIPLTPGGVGVVELGLTAALGAGLPIETRNQIAAAVLVFRAITWVLPIPLGAGCLLFWRANHSWRRTLEEREEWAGGAGRTTSAHEPEERPHVGDVELGLLEGGEVAAAGLGGPVLDVGVVGLGPGPHRRHDLLGEGRHPGRHAGPARAGSRRSSPSRGGPRRRRWR